MFDGLRTRAWWPRAAGLRPFFVAISGLSLASNAVRVHLHQRAARPRCSTSRRATGPVAARRRRRRSIGGAAFARAGADRLVEEAQSDNLDIAVAIALILQADAQSKIVGVPLLPIVTANASSIHSRPSKRTGRTARPPGGPRKQQLSSAVLNTATRSISGARTARSRVPRGNRRRQPLQQGGGRALHHRERRPRPISTCSRPRTAADRCAESRCRQSHPHAHQAARAGRHRLAARRRPAGERGGERARVDSADRPDPAPEHRHARGAGRPSTSRVSVKGGSLDRWHPAGDAGTAVRICCFNGPTSAPPRRISPRRCQRRSRARRILPEHHADRAGRLSERVLKRCSRRRRHFYKPPPTVAQPLLDGFRLEGQLSWPRVGSWRCWRPIAKSILVRIRRRREGPHRDRRHDGAERLQRQVVASARQAFELVRDAAAGGHHRPRDRAADPADPVPGREHSRRGRALHACWRCSSLFQALGGGWSPPGSGDRPILLR